MSKALLITTSVIFLAACEGTLTGARQTLSAGDLIKQYVESKAAARIEYDGKPIRIRGYVVGDVRMPGPDKPEGLILLGEHQGGDSRQVNCWFTRGEIEKFSRIARGTYATVEGIFNGERGTELRFCRLVLDEGP